MKVTLVLLTLGLGLLFACDKAPKELSPTTTDWGTGLNAVERTYAKPVVRISEIATATLKSFTLTIQSERRDELGGEIVALRADGHKVQVKMTAGDKDHTVVSIRVAPGNRALAEMIHERMAKTLGEPSEKAPTSSARPEPGP
jgi:hypothetical protein